MYRIHAGYHKCLTQYYMKVMRKLYNLGPGKDKYRHFESIEGVFYNNLHRYKVLSTNNFAIEANRIEGDFRISRFIRDPRDLIVSGYFYHKRGAEPWFRMKNPTAKYWEPLNANVPADMPDELSFSEYLQGLDKESGLLAEIEFRKHHLESMRNWSEDERIKLFKYEEILGREEEVFEEILTHYESSHFTKKLGKFWANRYKFKSKGKTQKHIRNPSPGQWQNHFTPKVEAFFMDNYGDLLEKYQY